MAKKYGGQSRVRPAQPEDRSGDPVLDPGSWFWGRGAATTLPFFTGLASSAVTIMLKALLNNDALPAVGMGLGMALSIFVFTVILLVFLRANRRGLR